MLPLTLIAVLITGSHFCSADEKWRFLDPEARQRTNSSEVSGRTKRDTRDTYLDDCGFYHYLQTRRSYTFTSQNFAEDKNYEANLACAWTFVGTATCIPEIRCPIVDFRPNGCNDNLIIMDGVGGKASLCGNQTLREETRASKGVRDLFITFAADPDRNFDRVYEGFSCTVRCSKKAEGAPVTALVNRGNGWKTAKCSCGSRLDDLRVVGGSDALKHEFPWQVAVVKPGTRKPLCGGSIINSRYVLTAAHCFYFTKAKPHQVEILVHAHKMDFSTKDDFKTATKINEDEVAFDFAEMQDLKEQTLRFRVTKILNHPLFTELYDFDACLLRLDRHIDFRQPPFVSPTCLPSPGNYANYASELPVVSGWGMPNETAERTVSTLQKLPVPVLSMETCRKAMPYDITDRMLCAGYLDGTQKDACQGDSGGPLNLQKPNSRYEQVGIVSWGEGCARKSRPGVFSRVTEFIQWIYFRSNEDGVTWCQE